MIEAFFWQSKETVSTRELMAREGIELKTFAIDFWFDKKIVILESEYSFFASK